MTQEFVTLPREVAEQAVAYIEMLNAGKWTQVTALAATLRASLDQPQNHVPDAGNIAPAGWKLVPVEPTNTMLDNAWSKAACHQGIARDAWRAMLNYAPTPEEYARHYAAAPKPPTVKECLTVEQPQSEQPAMTPIAQRKLDSLLAEGYTISGYSVYHEQKHQHGFVTGAGLVGWWRPEDMEYPQTQGEQPPVAWALYCADKLRFVGFNRHPLDGYHSDWSFRPLYTHPQPKREPLTDEQIDAIADAMPGGLEGFLKGWGWRQFARAVIEATNNIK